MATDPLRAASLPRPQQNQPGPSETPAAPDPVAPSLPDIRRLAPPELEQWLRDKGQPAYRASQVLEWLFRHRVASWDAMSNLPKRLRQELAAAFSLRPLHLVRRQGASDTTQKFLWQLPDAALIESVLIPANPALYGEASDRQTLCVSTQVGCAYGCKFCASGLDGWKRNLEVEEILEQVLATERWAAENAASDPAQATPTTEPTSTSASAANNPPVQSQPRESAPQERDRAVSNIVVMGMGEPLANYDNLMAALRILNAPWGGNIGARKITVSTSGLAPQIRRLAEEPLQLRLAISLHGATDEVRSRIMPVNRKYPLAELAAAAEFYQQKKGRMITLEYILIDGVNDGPDQVAPLADLARRLFAKVNLIPYNTVEGLPWRRPGEPSQEAFLAGLEARGTVATLRREKGHDIDAACGQLRLRTERELKLADAQPESELISRIPA